MGRSPAVWRHLSIGGYQRERRLYNQYDAQSRLNNIPRFADEYGDGTCRASCTLILRAQLTYDAASPRRDIVESCR